LVIVIAKTVDRLFVAEKGPVDQEGDLIGPPEIPIIPVGPPDLLVGKELGGGGLY
jgi:hypothetical protein